MAFVAVMCKRKGLEGEGRRIYRDENSSGDGT